MVVTTYETLGREYANAEKASLKKAESEPWVCELPTSVWNAEKEMDEYTGPPCKHSNDRKHQECQKCGGNVATVAVNQRASNMRRTGEIQAPIEKFFWNRVIADESHGKRVVDNGRQCQWSASSPRKARRSAARCQQEADADRPPKEPRPTPPEGPWPPLQYPTERRATPSAASAARSSWN